ncbi:hypothetical protein D3C78_821690 [compost metagenome]
MLQGTDHPVGHTGEGHVLRGQGQRPGATLIVAEIGQGQNAFRQFDTSAGCQTVRRHRLSQRHRYCVAAAAEQDRQGVVPANRHPTDRLGCQRQRQAGLLQLLPEFGRPLPDLNRADQRRLADISQNLFYGFCKHFPHGQSPQRSPSPRAIMLRRISRVPPRNEYEGEIWVT